MIQIVKKGPATFPAQCSFCGCLFTYELEDIKHQDYKQIIKCPVCKTEFNHPSQNKQQVINIPYSKESIEAFKSNFLLEGCDEQRTI